MTEGIIQEVIERNKKDSPHCTYTLEALQKELIEKIKQELTDNYYILNEAYVLKRLIGDNNDL